jgi:transcriptional regulator with XRE-family HTH domain
MGVNTQYISAIENGRKNITLEKLDELFIALDITAAKFFKSNN